jgi:hypothetical protein
MILRTVFLSLVFGGASALASGFSTNGAPPSTDQNNVWFLGKQTVEYCVQSGSSLGSAEASALVRESIDDWIRFFRKHQLDQMEFSDLSGGRNLGLALDFREIPKCDKPGEQIRFLFGLETKEIQEALKLQHLTYGLAYREKYNHQTLRTGGQVWVRGLPFGPKHAKHILLHELGHVFGMDHNSVYVMHEKAADAVRGMARSPQEFGQIEATTWPYRLLDRQTVEFSAHGRKNGRYEPNFVIVFLRDLFGFARDGFHSATLSLSLARGPGTFWDASFSFQDFSTGDTKQLTGRLRLKENRSSFKGLRGPSLYTNWGTTLMHHKYLDNNPSGMEAEGSMQFGGKSFPAIMERKNGLGVRLYLPHVDQWWSTEYYFNSAYGRDP